ncbi:cysteine-rich CWC family protein [Pseudomonas sp. M5]|uniref:cysteine-rich CWC family protein n=1 Tax=Pseudomonas sp. M5 TaxID=1620788 RepID=UPI0019573F7C|nr:cysteine-rich CWC family protein [Pseudomonas sp. M5]MBM7399544.1 ribosomal protein S27AE [Pseudomonas sp. M5]HDS1756472.1 cysteine-rich CWC family protein [Pseudomonas putida]
MNDSQRCPACGALNQCTLADPRTAPAACWCYAVNIDPAVLKALPTELRDKSCLCPRCAAGAGLPENAPAQVEAEKR